MRSSLRYNRAEQSKHDQNDGLSHGRALLEVHPPHHAISGWKDFFVHIGTITVGLLIAIGLEQSVEAVHHHHELAQLREDLRRECESNKERLKSGIYARERAMPGEIARGNGIATTFSGSNSAYDYPGLPANAVTIVVQEPADPVWSAARQGQAVALMSREEIGIYSEISDLIAESSEHRKQHTSMLWQANVVAAEAVTTRGADRSWHVDLSALSIAQRHQYLVLYSQALSLSRSELSVLEELDRVETALLDGAKTLDQVLAVEDNDTKPWEKLDTPAKK